MAGPFDIDAFRDRGYAHITDAMTEPDVGAMRDRLWSALAGQDVRPDDAATWPSGSASGLRSIRRGELGPDGVAALRVALDAVFGTVPRTTPGHWGQALVAFPEPGPWSLPRAGWHCDYPFWFAPDAIWGVVAFLFLDDVDARGGATLALEGSPASVRDAIAGRDDLGTAKPTSVLTDVLARVPALATATEDELCAGVRAADGTPLRLVELTGRAGDVVVCHTWLLHRASANTTARPRLQRAARVQRRFDV